MARLSKARRRSSIEIEKTKQAIYKDILEEFIPLHRTWSARMPTYCFTVLCPDTRYRPGGELYIKGQKK